MFDAHALHVWSFDHHRWLLHEKCVGNRPRTPSGPRKKKNYLISLGFYFSIGLELRIAHIQGRALLSHHPNKQFKSKSTVCSRYFWQYLSVVFLERGSWVEEIEEPCPTVKKYTFQAYFLHKNRFWAPSGAGLTHSVFCLLHFRCYQDCSSGGWTARNRRSKPWAHCGWPGTSERVPGVCHSADTIWAANEVKQVKHLCGSSVFWVISGCGHSWSPQRVREEAYLCPYWDALGSLFAKSVGIMI